MYLRLILFSCAALAITGQRVLSQETGNTPERPLRVMSYNIRNCIGMDMTRDYDRTAGVITSCGAGIVALQEIDSMTLRSGRTDVLGIMARITGMHPTYGPAIDFDGGKYGVGLLSREKPLRCENIPLPGREEGRTLLAVEFEDYIVCCTHLSLTAEDRMSSVTVILTLALMTGKPLLLAGDFNAAPDSPEIGALSQVFTILSDTGKDTFPAGAPYECIDFIMAAGMPEGFMATGRYTDPAVTASDHCPVWVDVAWPAK